MGREMKILKNECLICKAPLEYLETVGPTQNRHFHRA